MLGCGDSNQPVLALFASYQLMRSCWELDPANRPAATQLVEKLSEEVLHVEQGESGPIPLAHPYYNVKSPMHHCLDDNGVCEEQVSDRVAPPRKEVISTAN